jgi:hypothetical protein
MTDQSFTHEKTRGVALTIGPLNTAGQGFQWAEACRRFRHIDAQSFAGTRAKVRKIDGRAHLRSLHHRTKPTFAKVIAMSMILRETTHHLNESFTTLTGDQRTQDLRHDLPWLRNKSIDVGVLFHGSDIRSPERHMDSEPFSYYRLMEPTLITRFEREADARRTWARESGLPLFVSTPDLLEDLPEATWLPVVADIPSWLCQSRPFEGKKIRVLHAPSRRVPPIKGTSFIDPVLRHLAEEGLIEYLSPDSIAHLRMAELVKSVDVVVDQILSGSYGVAAVEAMAARRLVIGNLGSKFRRNVGIEIPIVDSGPEQLEATIRAIVEKPDSYITVADQGPAYVQEVHSGERSSAVLAHWISGSEIRR